MDYFRCPHCDRLISNIEDYLEQNISDLLDSLSDRFTIGEVEEKEKQLYLVNVDSFGFYNEKTDLEYIKEHIKHLPYIFKDISRDNGYLVLVFEREDIF